MAKLTGTCWCDVLVTHGVNGFVNVEEYDGAVHKTVTCSRCYAAEAEAENRSLEDAESGRGLERLLDNRYHTLYDD